MLLSCSSVCLREGFLSEYIVFSCVAQCVTFIHRMLLHLVQGAPVAPPAAGP